MTVEDMEWKKISQQSIRNAEHVLISCGLEDMAAVQALQAIGKTVLCTNLYPEAQYSPITVFTEKDVVKCKKILDKAGIGTADQDQVLDSVVDFLTDGQIQRNTFQAAKTDEDDMLFISKEDKALLHKLICNNLSSAEDISVNDLLTQTDLLRRMGFIQEAEYYENLEEKGRE